MSKDQSNPAVIGRIRKNFGLVATGQAVAIGLSFVALTINTRALGLHDLGQLFLVQATCELVAILIAFPNWQSFLKVGAEIENRGNLMSLWVFGLKLDIASASVASLISISLLLIAPGVVGLDANVALVGVIYAISLVFTATSTSVGALRLFDAFDQAVAVDILRAVLLLANSVVLAWFQAPLEAYLISIPILISISGLLMVILARRCLRQKSKAKSPSRIDVIARKRFLKFALGVNFESAMNAVRQRGEILFVSSILGPSAAGLYGVAYRLSALISRFAESARVSAFPEFSRMVAQKRLVEVIKLAIKLILWTSAFAVCIVAGLWVFGDAILSSVFGPEFGEAATILMVLGVAAALQASLFPLALLVPVVYGSWRLVVLNFVAFICFVTFGVLGPLRFGIYGVGAGAAAFALVLSALLVAQIFLLSKRVEEEGAVASSS